MSTTPSGRYHPGLWDAPHPDKPDKQPPPDRLHYSTESLEELARLFPNDEHGLTSFANDGAIFVPNALSRHDGWDVIDPDDVLEQLRRGSEGVSKLEEKARRALRVRELAIKMQAECDQWHRTRFPA